MVPFNSFEEEVRKACLAPVAWEPPAQVAYLASYLRSGDMRAKAMVVERPYVDRHFIEEFSAYYATAFRAPSPHTTRLHFFSCEFDDERLGAWLRDAAAGRRDEVECCLQLAYLGFVTVRPIASAPIGRSVLRPYGDHSSRLYMPADTIYTVHLLGLRLTVRGLPFQQQEQAVGACATTAVWSALARAARASGARSPTPFMVTYAATRHYTENRPFPAVGGLELSQITAAVRELGFAPYVMKPTGEFSTFVLSLKTYVSSGIPAVLVIDEGVYHAVAVAGFRRDDEEHPAAPIRVQANSSAIESVGISRLYIHDDRFGPYVRMELSDNGNGEPILRRLPRHSDAVKPVEADVCYAVFPLYPKLRLTARELIDLGGRIAPFLRTLLGEQRERLRVDFRFTLSGDYLRELYMLGLPAPQVEAFMRAVTLSRYVGVIRFFLDDEALADVLCDTTDIARDTPPGSPVLAFIPFSAKHVEQFREYAKQYFAWALVA